MITRVLAVVVLLAALSTSAAAQQWSAEQLAVIESIGSCWDAWTAAQEARDYSIWADKCLASEDATFMWADGGFWSVIDWERGILNKWFQPDNKWQWVALRPARVIVDDDLALVFFSPIWVSTDADGKTTREESQRRLRVMKRNDGIWKFLGGVGFLSSDADD